MLLPFSWVLPLGPTPKVLARTLASAGVGAGTLTAHRKRTTMTETAIAAEIHQALDALLNLATRVAFDLDGRFDGVADCFDVGFGQLVDLARLGHVGGFAQRARGRGT